MTNDYSPPAYFASLGQDRVDHIQAIAVASLIIARTNNDYQNEDGFNDLVKMPLEYLDDIASQALCMFYLGSWLGKLSSSVRPFYIVGAEYAIIAAIEDLRKEYDRQTFFWTELQNVAEFINKRNKKAQNTSEINSLINNVISSSDESTEPE